VARALWKSEMRQPSELISRIQRLTHSRPRPEPKTSLFRRNDLAPVIYTGGRQ
jgi:hypothetical protein